MQNLNKDNFWDQTEATFPDTFKMFSDWIDKYKAEVGWDNLFNQEGLTDVDKPVKFHDLPIEFQIGIIARFHVECRYDLQNDNGKTTWHEMIRHEPLRIKGIFRELQTIINLKK